MLRADWAGIDTVENLERRIGNGFRVRIGWQESKIDTILCLEVPLRQPGVMRYQVMIWNRTGIRATLAELLGLPVKST